MIDELEKKQSEMLSAFPNGNLFPGNRGLTMRDAFAIGALPALVQHLWNAEEIWLPQIAEEAYALADAMLKAREKP